MPVRSKPTCRRTDGCLPAISTRWTMCRSGTMSRRGSACRTTCLATADGSQGERGALRAGSGDRDRQSPTTLRQRRCSAPTGTGPTATLTSYQTATSASRESPVNVRVFQTRASAETIRGRRPTTPTCCMAGESADFNWESAAGVQHELFRGTSLNFGYYRRWYGNQTVTDNTLVDAVRLHHVLHHRADRSRICRRAANGCAASPTSRRRSSVRRKTTSPSPRSTANRLRSTTASICRSTLACAMAFSCRVDLSTGRTELDACFVIDSPQALIDCNVAQPFRTQYKLLWCRPSAVVGHPDECGVQKRSWTGNQRELTPPPMPRSSSFAGSAIFRPALTARRYCRSFRWARCSKTAPTMSA